MAPDTATARARLDHVEAGLDAVESALARLDAGEVDETVPDAGDEEHVDASTDGVGADDTPDAPAEPDANG